MRRISSLVLIDVIAAVFVFLAAIASADAHPGHFPDASVAPHGSASGVAHDARLATAALPHRIELHAPGCPGDGPGNCCCTQDAHVPLPSSQFALPAATVRFAAPARVTRLVVEVPAIPVARPTVIGSRGSRGPPSPSSFR
ncbi:MAG TPA: hypothetical protein VFS06_15575 [Casimicrobiaceae bacterium]|nr:hypothetical protein [Casimicrobiaceae bacterium]